MFFSLSLQPQINFKASPQSLVTLILLAGVPASILGNEGALRWGRRRFITMVMFISGLIGCLIGFSASLTFIMVAGLCFAYWIAIITDSGSLNAGLVSAARAEEAGRTMALYSFVGLSMGFLAPLAVGTVLDITGGGIAGWGLAFATLGVVAMSGTVWLRLFRSNNKKK
jgi:MFS family permease